MYILFIASSSSKNLAKNLVKHIAKNLATSFPHVPYEYPVKENNNVLRFQCFFNQKQKSGLVELYTAFAVPVGL